MARIINYFYTAFNIMKDSTTLFWGGYFFMVFFYLGLFIIVLLEKERTKKFSIVGYCLIVLIGIYNPVTFFVARRAFGGDNIAYFSRLFSLLPVYLVMAYASYLVLGFLKGLKKLAVTALLCICIIVFGENVYQQDWIIKAENPQKFSTDVIQVADAVHGTKENVCIVAPDILSTYLRQYDASLYMPYGRSSLNRPHIMNIISSVYPDPAEALRLAGNESCDYLVVYKNQENYNAFLNAGQELFAETDNFLIFALKDIERIERTINEKSQVITETWLDNKNQPSKCSKGYSTAKYTYDCYGNQNGEYYFDETMNPVTDIYTGCFGLKKEWDYRPVLKKITYIDAEGMPMLSSYGYASASYAYDNKRRRNQELYFDADGNPVQVPKGYCGIQYEYNSGNQLSSIFYLDEKGNYTETEYGYSGLLREYDSSGNVVSESYYNERRQSKSLADGYHRVRTEYNDQNNIVKISYYDVSDRPVVINKGYAVISYSYDEMGRQTGEYYYNIDGEPALLSQGYAGIEKTFNDQNQIIRFTYIGTDHLPVIITAGYAVEERYYEKSGNIALKLFYDTQGNRIVLSTGFSGVQQEFDEDGKLIKITYLDNNNEPVMVNNLYASVKYVYDESGNRTEEYYLDADGKRIEQIIKQ